jgi:LysR family transcriptional regulator, glycine cleavage system transcriptional activator
MEMVRNIKSVQVFYAVFRTRSLTAAAKTLNISQSSLSYHIKKLEDDLGLALFHRTASGLEPTEAGAMLAVHVDSGLSTIRTGLRQATMHKTSVRFALLPMFSTRWLSSRLATLMDDIPEMGLTIHTHVNDYALMDHPAQFADLGMQWGRGNWDRFHATKLWSERMAVVCSPAYLAEHRIAEPADLARCTLIHVDDHGMWQEWFARHGLDITLPNRQMVLEDRHFQLSSTIDGLGVSLFADWLVAEELARGALVSPFDELCPTDYAYHLIHPKDIQLSPTARTVHDCIIRMAWTDTMRRSTPTSARAANKHRAGAI